MDPKLYIVDINACTHYTLPTHQQNILSVKSSLKKYFWICDMALYEFNQIFCITMAISRISYLHKRIGYIKR